MISNRFKKIFVGFIGFFLAFIHNAKAGEGEAKVSPIEFSKNEDEAKMSFNKDQLIRELKILKRDARSIKTITASCYNTERMPRPESIEYQCSICGHNHSYSSNSAEYDLVGSLPYIKRSFSALPYKITIDSTSLCPVCGKGKDKALVANVSCFSCGTQFSWQIKDSKDIEMLNWLFVEMPLSNHAEWRLGILGDDREKKTNEGIRYIIDHVFCPECRKKIGL